MPTTVADEASRAADGSPPRLRRSRPVVIVLALAFFFTPAVAAAVGVRATHIENKKLSSFPTAHDGWGIFADFDSWATDHLPLRDKAVEANTDVERNVFDENPNYGSNGQTTTTAATGTVGVPGAPGVPDVPGVPGVGVPQQAATAPPTTEFPVVVGGNDGWLFYGTDFKDACQTVLSPAVIAQRFQRLSDIVRTAGKQFVLMIAPDKTDIYSEHVPGSVAAKSCAIAGENAFWAALAADPPTGYVDVHSALLQAKNADPTTLLYLKTGTHWNQTGALIYTHLLADSLDPTLWQTTQVRDAGPANINTDLRALLGEKGTESAEMFSVTRPGVTSVVDSASRIENTTTDAPLVTKKTLLISDSFTDASRFAVTPLFANATLINSEGAGSEPTTLDNAIKSSSIVVVEIVERAVVGGQSPILTTSYLDGLAAALGEG